MGKKLIYAIKTNDKIAKHLGRYYKVEYWDKHKEDENSVVGILADFSKFEEIEAKLNAIIDYSMTMKVPMIFLNVSDSDYISKKYGICIASKALVVHPYNDFDVFDIIDEQYESINNPSIIFQDCKKAYTMKNPGDYICSCSYNNPIDIANKINEQLNEEFILPVGVTDRPGLPEAQYKQIYLRINHKTQISKSSGQKCDNEIILEITLYASYDPAYKYLRVRTLGTGLTPGNLTSNTSQDKGWFQGHLNITMHPQDDNLVILSDEPKNVNGVMNYTSGSRFTIGVNASANPGFNPSYSIESRETTGISDFEITNKTVNNKAQWDWLMGIFKKGLFDVNFWGHKAIKDLPTLAVDNLQPTTDTVWYVDNKYTKKIEFIAKFEEDFFYASTTCPSGAGTVCAGSYRSIKQTYGYYNNKLITINFSVVHP